MPPADTEPRSREVPADAARAALDKLLASKHFAQSDRLTRFLRFTVEHTLQGRAASLKEYLLGVEVFDRKPSYDPRVEPIVRVEARRLRTKLQKYYETDGRDDPLRIELPTGSYAPVFRRPEASAAPAATQQSLAVLPFLNLSSDPDNEYFSHGLTEELIHALTKVEGLRVVAALQLKGKAHDVRQVGQQLGVGAVLQGSVRRSGDRLRVTAQLIQVSDGAYLWSETYERRMKDVFAIQDEISRAIVDTLRIRLGARPEAPLVRCHTHNLEAYQLYLKAAITGTARRRKGCTRPSSISSRPSPKIPTTPQPTPACRTPTTSWWFGAPCRRGRSAPAPTPPPARPWRWTIRWPRPTPRSPPTARCLTGTGPPRSELSAAPSS